MTISVSSVSSESRLKNGVREFCPPNVFICAFLHQNEDFDNLRPRKFEVNKIHGKSLAKGKDAKYDKWVSHVINYQRCFSRFHYLFHIKCF